MTGDLISTLLSEAQYDYIGLWEVMGKCKLIDQNDQSPEVIRSRTLDIVFEMLANGFLAVDLLPSGGCRPWDDQNPNAVLQRIDAKWRSQGREPNIGDIVWFSIKKMN